MNAIKSLLMGCLLAVAAVYGSPVLSSPQTGWWWNPAESGRGFFVESDGEITFIGAYLYDDDGHATWLVAGSANADAYDFTGQLFSLSNGQTLYGTYVAPSAPNYAGTISAHFTDDTHGTITWPGGTVAIERQIFGGADRPVFEPIPGWWWNPEESGSGYSIELQGDQLFVVGFMYDETGRPVWYFSAGPMASASTYHGTVMQFANGQTMGGTYHPPGTPVAIGTLDIEFTANDEATLTFTEGAASREGAEASRLQPQANKHSKKKIKPEFPKPPRYYDSTFDLTDVIDAGAQKNTITYSAAMDWSKHGANTWDMDAARLDIDVQTKMDVAPLSCHGSGRATLETPDFPTTTLTIDKDRVWHLPFDAQKVVQVTTTCTGAGVTTTRTSEVSVALRFQYFGPVYDDRRGSPARVNWAFWGNVKEDVSPPTWTRSGPIDFVPRWK